jgi:hypothetical protein
MSARYAMTPAEKTAFRAGKAVGRAEALREAAEALRVEHRRIFWATKPDTCPEAEFLDRMADATARPDSRPAATEAGEVA